MAKHGYVICAHVNHPADQSQDRPPVHDALAVVILNLNRSNDTLECVRSVQGSRIENTRILVVDNGSARNDFDRLSSNLRNDVELMRLSENIGVSAAWNVAIRYLRSELDPKYVLLLNNDTIVESTTMGELVEFLQWNSSAGAVGPRVVTYTKPHELQYHHLKGTTVPTVDYSLSGCALMIRMNVFDCIGLFDQDYFVYSEECDFLARMKTSPWLPFYVPTVGRVFHKGAATSRLVSGFEAYHRSRSALVFAAKNRRGLDLFMYVVVYHMAIQASGLLLDTSLDGRPAIASRIRGTLAGLITLVKTGGNRCESVVQASSLGDGFERRNDSARQIIYVLSEGRWTMTH